MRQVEKRLQWRQIVHSAANPRTEGGAENAGMENAGLWKIRGWKTQNRKTRDQISRVEKAGTRNW